MIGEIMIVSIILLVILIIGALVFLALAVFSSIQYGKMTGEKVVDTDGSPLPTGSGSFVRKSREEMNADNPAFIHKTHEEMNGATFVYRKEAYKHKTKGKEAGFHFSISNEDLRKGLKEKDPLVTKQFWMSAGYAYFTACTMSAIGLGIVMGGGSFGWIFIAAGLFVGSLFFYQVFLKKDVG